MKYKTKLKQFVSACVIAASLTACDTPEEKAQNYIQDGMEYFEEGTYDKAVIEFKNALQIDDKLVDAWYGISLAEEKRQQWQQVAGALKRTLDLSPEHLEALVRLGRLVLVASQIDMALEYSNTAISIAPNDTRTNSLQASVLFKLGDSEGAIRYAEKALELDPKNSDALIVLAAQSLKADQGEKALSYLDQAIALSENKTSLKLIKIQTLTHLQKNGEAENIFKGLISLNPKDISLKNGLVLFYINQKRFDDAEQELRNIAALAPEKVEPNLRVVKYLNDLHGSDKAIEELKQLIQQRKDKYRYQMTLANLLFEKGEKVESENIVRSIVNSDVTQSQKNDALLRLAEIFVVDKEYDRSQEIISQILKEDTRNNRALIIRAAIKSEQEQYDSAIEDLRSVLNDDPSSVKALMILARAHAQNGSLELADDRFGMAFRASDHSPKVGLHYADFLINKGSLQRAEDSLLKVLQTGKANIAILRLLTQVRMKLGDWTGAQQIVDTMREQGESASVVNNFQGLIFTGQEKYNQSIDAFKAVYNETPQEAQPLISLFRSYVKAGKIKEAQNFIESTIVANEENAISHTLLAHLHLIQKNQELAEASLLKAVKYSDDKDERPYLNLTKFYMSFQQLEKAKQVLDEGINKNNKSSSLLLLKAGYHEMKEEREEAIQTYEAMLNIDPESEIASNNLANLLLKNEGDQAALDKAYELAKEFKNSTVPHFRDTLGLVYLQKGETDNALELFQSAVGDAPTLPVFQYHLGMGYLAKGDKDAAISALKETMQLSEKFSFTEKENVQKILEELNASSKVE